MDRELWKLEKISEKIWFIASTIAVEAASLGDDGRGFAVVAEETRSVSLKISELVERAIFEGASIEKQTLTPLITEVSYLAINVMIEANRKGERGKGVSVCADDIRTLALEMMRATGEDVPPTPVLYPNKPITTAASLEHFIAFQINGNEMVENLRFVMEVVKGLPHDGKVLKLRGMTLPIVNAYEILGGKLGEQSSFIIIDTPWDKTRQRYAVAVDENGNGGHHIFYCPLGTPVAPPEGEALASVMREYWESEVGDGFRFMAWWKFGA